MDELRTYVLNRLKSHLTGEFYCAEKAKLPKPSYHCQKLRYDVRCEALMGCNDEQYDFLNDNFEELWKEAWDAVDWDAVKTSKSFWESLGIS